MTESECKQTRWDANQLLKNQFVIWLGFILLIIIVATLRWPRLDKDVVTVTRCDVTRDRMEIEYRMPVNFKVAAVQYLKLRSTEDRPDTGTLIGANIILPTKKKKIATIASRYDYLRGEHVVRMTYLLADKPTILADGKEYPVTTWANANLETTEWIPHTPPEVFGDSTSVPIVHLGVTPEHEESIHVFAGTEIENYLSQSQIEGD